MQSYQHEGERQGFVVSILVDVLNNICLFCMLRYLNKKSNLFCLINSVNPVCRQVFIMCDSNKMSLSPGDRFSAINYMTLMSY